MRKGSWKIVFLSIIISFVCSYAALFIGQLLGFGLVEKPMHAWIAASVISSLLFGMMHVNVYHWNMWQCLVVIGLTRLPFNWAWRKTDSLWGGIWAHIIYDLIIFVPAIFFF